jgi:hypothetical protein
MPKIMPGVALKDLAKVFLDLPAVLMLSFVLCHWCKYP